MLRGGDRQPAGWGWRSRPVTEAPALRCAPMRGVPYMAHLCGSPSELAL